MSKKFVGCVNNFLENFLVRQLALGGIVKNTVDMRIRISGLQLIAFDDEKAFPSGTLKFGRAIQDNGLNGGFKLYSSCDELIMLILSHSENILVFSEELTEFQCELELFHGYCLAMELHKEVTGYFCEIIVQRLDTATGVIG